MLPSPARQITLLPSRATAAPIGGGQIVAHRRTAGVGEQPLAVLELRGLKRHDARRGIAADDHVVIGQRCSKSVVDEMVGIDRPVDTRGASGRTTGNCATRSLHQASQLGVAAGLNVGWPRLRAPSPREIFRASQWIGRSGPTVGLASSAGSTSTWIL